MRGRKRTTFTMQLRRFLTIWKRMWSQSSTSPSSPTYTIASQVPSFSEPTNHGASEQRSLSLLVLNSPDIENADWTGRESWIEEIEDDIDVEVPALLKPEEYLHHISAPPTRCTACRGFYYGTSTNDKAIAVSLETVPEAAERGCETCQALFMGIMGMLQLQNQNLPMRPLLQSQRERTPLLTEWPKKWLASNPREFILCYDGSPKLKSPRLPASWSLRCSCRAFDTCKHGRNRLNFDIFTLQDAHQGSAFSPNSSRLIHSNSTGSDDTMAFIKQCLDHCVKKHASCHVKFAWAKFPMRMLEVHDDFVQLVELQDLQPVRYICLAHKWAPEVPKNDEYEASRGCRTLQWNLEQHKEGIPTNVLLSTYRDAVTVTRALGIKYLWIDSLCIIQDNQEDKEIQIANMGEVYALSYLTIAADCGENHTKSFFTERSWQWRANKRIIHDAAGIQHEIYFRERLRHDLSWTGIFERSWCFQERLLSSRIIRFQKDEVIFECNEDLTCECGNPPAGYQGPWEALSKNYHLHDKAAFNYLRWTSRPSLWSSLESQPWHSLVQRYSQTSLTYESDRIDAIAGIASQMYTSMDGRNRYLAGLWSETLFEDMLWSAAMFKTSSQPWDTNKQEPSWSWISIMLGVNSIHYPCLVVEEIFPLLVKSHYQPRSTHFPLGHVVEGAYIEVEGQLTPALVGSQRMTIWEFSSTGKLPPLEFLWDPGREPSTQHRETVFLLRMALLRGGDMVKEAFLILRLIAKADLGCNTHMSCLTRAGYLEISRDKDSEPLLQGLEIEERYQTLRIY